MSTNLTDSSRLDILGDRNCSTATEVLTTLLKKWRQRLGYFSIFAAIPGMLGMHVTEARADEAKKLEPKFAGRDVRRFAGLNRSVSSTGLLKRQSAFRLPHQKGNFSMAAAVAGNDNCPGRSIPGGSYTAAARYIDSGDTTGANDTFSSAHYYYYYTFDAFGPDHIYSFTLTGRGPNAQIQVSTTSSTYKPLIYVLYGGFSEACPGGASNITTYAVLSSGAPPGGTATLNSSQLNILPLNFPLHLVIDSPLNNANGSGPYTLFMQDVTIAPPACPNNPIDCPEYFLYRHYFDFLGREPDPPGLAAWQALLAGCAPGDTTCDRIHVSSAFFRSSEFQGRGYFLYRFYPAALGRKPDFDEFIQDLWTVSGFLTDAELEAAKLGFILDFMNRAAFATAYNGLSDTQYVDKLLVNAGITHPARNFWIGALGNGTRTRAQVLREIAESSEVYNKYYNQAFVVMQYFGYLRRQPDALYLNWLSLLDATGDYRNMTNGFVNSLEYRNRFGPH